MILMLVYVCCIYLCVYAQDVSETGTQVLTQTTGTKLQESSIIIEQTQADTTNDTVPSTNSVWYLVRMLLTLCLVIACIYAVVYFLKKTGNSSFSSDLYVKKLASLTLSTGRAVYVITVGNQAFLIGSGESSIQLIAEITDKDLIDAMHLNAEKNTSGSKPKDFSSLLTKFFPGSTAQGENPSIHKTSVSSHEPNDVAQSAAETAEFLRRHRERFSASTDDSTEVPQ